MFNVFAEKHSIYDPKDIPNFSIRFNELKKVCNNFLKFPIMNSETAGIEKFILTAFKEWLIQNDFVKQNNVDVVDCDHKNGFRREAELCVYREHFISSINERAISTTNYHQDTRQIISTKQNSYVNSSAITFVSPVAYLFRALFIVGPFYFILGLQNYILANVVCSSIIILVTTLLSVHKKTLKENLEYERGMIENPPIEVKRLPVEVESPVTETKKPIAKLSYQREILDQLVTDARKLILNKLEESSIDLFEILSKKASEGKKEVKWRISEIEDITGTLGSNNEHVKSALIEHFESQGIRVEIEDDTVNLQWGDNLERHQCV
jgi:hypothetical protein